MRKGTVFADFLSLLRAHCDEIDRGQPRPLYLIHGGQDYFLEWAATNLLDHLLPGASRQEGLTVFDCRARDPGNAGPLMEGEASLFGLHCRQVLLVKNPPVSATEAKRFPGRLLTNPPPRTVVIVTSSREVPAGSAFLKHFSDRGAILRVPTIDSQEQASPFLRFLATRNPRSRVKADQGVLQEVLVRVGTEEPRHLVREMEKLSLYVGPDRPATLDDIQEIITPSAPESAFALLAQIAGRKPTQALATLTFLLEQRVPHPVIIGAIGQELRRLLQARTVLDSGGISSDLLRGGFDRFRGAFNDEKRVPIAKKFPPGRRDNLFLQHPFVIYRCLQQALSFNQKGLIAALAAVVEADFQLKVVPRPESQILERLILELGRQIAPLADAPR